MKPKYPSQIADKYIVRFPEGLKPWIEQEAARNERSINAEIVFRLKEARRQQEETEAKDPQQ